MKTFKHFLIFGSLALLLVIFKAQAKILTNCEAAKELKKSKICHTFISNWVCLMKSESNMNTSLIKGPGSLSSYSHGIFQISSIRWCKRGRKGGECNAKCEDFLDEKISDDIACAELIFNAEGFKYWQGWMKQCKGKPLPNLGSCKYRRNMEEILKSLFHKSDSC